MGIFTPARTPTEDFCSAPRRGVRNTGVPGGAGLRASCPQRLCATGPGESPAGPEAPRPAPVGQPDSFVSHLRHKTVHRASAHEHRSCTAFVITFGPEGEH